MIFSGGAIGIQDTATERFAWIKGGVNPNAYAYVQNDDNFVIYGPSNSGPEWATGINNKVLAPPDASAQPTGCGRGTGGEGRARGHR